MSFTNIIWTEPQVRDLLRTLNVSGGGIWTGVELVFLSCLTRVACVRRKNSKHEINNFFCICVCHIMEIVPMVFNKQKGAKVIQNSAWKQMVDDLESNVNKTNNREVIVFHSCYQKEMKNTILILDNIWTISNLIISFFEPVVCF